MMEGDWAELCTVTDESEAEIIRSLLSTEQIPVMFRSHLARNIYPSLSQVKLFVPEQHLSAAQAILKASRAEEP